MTDDQARQVLDQLRRMPAVASVREAIDHALISIADRTALIEAEAVCPRC